MSPESRAALEAAFAEFREVLSTLSLAEATEAVGELAASLDESGLFDRAVARGVMTPADRDEMKAFAAQWADNPCP